MYKSYSKKSGVYGNCLEGLPYYYLPPKFAIRPPLEGLRGVLEAYKVNKCMVNKGLR